MDTAALIRWLTAHVRPLDVVIVVGTRMGQQSESTILGRRISEQRIVLSSLTFSFKRKETGGNRSHFLALSELAVQPLDSFPNDCGGQTSNQGSDKNPHSILSGDYSCCVN